ncbi:MAG: rRNA maturation RNase YbeY [Rhodanobacter sp.]|jgi:probable rRNA maturation factor|nr:rRNA maturation RNase YbeY [Rhodanobacter sp.]
MAVSPRARTITPDPSGKVCLWLKNEAGRRGVPLLRSFERWIEAIPELRERHGWTELNILIVGRAAARRFNRTFCGRDYATNVLSFPYDPMPGEHSGLLGDLVICAAVVAKEAREQRKDARDHFAHLTIHGVLHLLGYDHETEPDAQRMEALECEVLARLGIADPY